MTWANFTLFDELGHAYRYATLTELGIHFDYLASKGFTGILWSATGRFEDPSNNTSTRWGGDLPIFSNVSTTNCTINPTWGNHMRSVVDRANQSGLKVALVSRGSQSAINDSNSGDLRTQNATDFGNQLVQYFGSATNIWAWIHGWDDSRIPNGSNQEDQIWTQVTAAIRAGSGAATQAPVTYHTNPGNQFKFANASWLDFHCIQTGHNSNAQDSGWWNTILSNTSKNIFFAEPRYAHVYEDSGTGGQPPNANTMRLDMRAALQYGTQRLIGSVYGDWYRVTFCSYPNERSQFNNAITTGYANGVATTRLPGPNNYSGATNLIGNSGETAYIEEINAVFGSSPSHTVGFTWTTSSSYSGQLNLSGATLPLNTPVYIRANISPDDATSVTWFLDTAQINTDNTTPWNFEGDSVSHTFTTNTSHVIRLDLLAGGVTTQYNIGFTVGTTSPPPTGNDEGYFTLNGTSQYLSTPDAADLDITGAIDFRARLAPTDWNAIQYGTIVGKFGTGSSRSYRFTTTQWDIRTELSAAGGGTEAIIANGFPGNFVDGEPQWVRMVATPAAGTGAFYTSIDGAAWTLISNLSFTPIASTFSGTSPVEIGRLGGASSDWLAGKIYYVEMRNGINGTIVFKTDFRTETQATWSSGSSWADGYGHTWTANGTPTYTASTTVTPAPAFTATLNGLSVDLAWTGGATVDVDERVNNGAWISAAASVTTPETVGPYVAGDHVEFRMVASSNPTGTPSTNFIDIPTAITGSIRINAAGPLVADVLGDWEPDLTEAASGTNWSNDSTNSGATSPSLTISNLSSLPAALFNSERYKESTATMAYSFTGLTGGNDYQLRLILAEQFFGGTAPGQRSFNVEVNGILAHSNVDPIAAVGAATAYTLVSTHQPSTNIISVNFLTGSANNPLINALELVDLGTGTAPTTPTAATAFTATATGPSSINLGWTDNATNESSYRVERSLDNVVWGNPTVLPANSSASAVNGLLPNTLYYFRVRPELSGAIPPAWATANATTDPAVTNTGIPIPVGSDPNTIIAGYGPGTEFLFAAGTHRVSVNVRAGDIYNGTVDGSGNKLTIISGATVLTGWVQDGARWRKDGMTQNESIAPSSPDNLPTHPRARTSHEMFYDGNRLHHAGSLTTLGNTPPSTRASSPVYSWFFDYNANSVYTNAPNPNSHTLELADKERAFTGSVPNVKLNDLIVQMYRNPAQTGPAEPGSETVIDGWEIDRCTFRYNHGNGVKIRGSNWKVLNTEVHHNGQLGIASGQFGWAENVVVFNVDCHNNNVSGFQPGWEAGGSKFVRTKNLSVTYSKFYNNVGPGLWTDIDNIFYDASYNEVYDNDGMGIFHEISQDATIHHNTVHGNGFSLTSGVNYAVWAWGAGILIASSPNAEVYDNYVYGNHSGITLIDQARVLTGQYAAWGFNVPQQDVSSDTSIFDEINARSNTDCRLNKGCVIHHNDIQWSGGLNGVLEDWSNKQSHFSHGDFFRSGSFNPQFNDNDYTNNPTPNGFHEVNNGTNFAGWQSLGHDTSNAGVRDATPTPGLPPNFVASTVDQDTLQLSWGNATNATSYRLEYNDFSFAGGFSFLVSIAGTSHTHNNLNPATTYYYRLRAENDTSPVFTPPGAPIEGTTSDITGGIGKPIYTVTNLNNSGAGSLRDALSVGDRQVVFSVAGNIELNTVINVSGNNITVRGETAPSPGICVKIANTTIDERTFLISGDNIIFQWFRIRPNGKRDPSNSDGILIQGSNIAINHCSLSWATDELIDLYENGASNSNIVIQWCMFYECLTPHAFAALISSSGSWENIMIHHNIWAHMSERHPRFNATNTGLNTIDWRNNLHYNMTSHGSIDMQSASGVLKLNAVNNKEIAGASTTARTDSLGAAADPGATTEVYQSGNTQSGGSLTEWLDSADSAYEVGSPTWSAPAVTTYSIAEMEATVKQYAGASHRLDDGNWVYSRDDADVRIITDITNGTGDLISDPASVGGYPF